MLLLAWACIWATRYSSPGPADDPGTKSNNRSVVDRSGGPDRPASTAVAIEPTIQQEVCAKCHADVVADYRRNGMSRSWRAASPSLVKMPNAETVVRDQLSGYQYHVVVKDDAIWQVETHTKVDGHHLKKRAEYLIGSGTHAQAMITAENGYLSQMPVAWFKDGRAWRLNPGFELQNHRFSRPITAGCVACHATHAVNDVPSPNRFQLPVSNGIECRRCHGPAARHVAFHSGSDKSGSASHKEYQEARLVDPRELPPARANDVCFQCHLQGDVTVYKDGRSPFDFRPGDRLLDYRHDFLIKPSGPTQLGVASHGARMLQSRCYTESDGRLTCILCHDTHRPSSDEPPSYYDRKCVTCHSSDACTRVGPRNAGRPDSSCISCHMPRRSTREGIHLVFTDHAILRNGEPLSPKVAATEMLKPNANVTLVSSWPEERPNARTFAAAHVMLHELMGPQIPSMEKAAEMLEQVVVQSSMDLESRYWLASALIALHRGREAVPHLTTVLRNQPRRHSARFRLAVAYELTGDYRSAASHYRRLLDDAPGWMRPYNRLAQVHMQNQQAARAMRVLSQRLDYQQDANAYALLGLAQRLQGGGHEQALQSIVKALELDPLLPAAFVNRGVLHLLEEENNLARRDFKRALELDPENVQAEQALRSLGR